MTNNPLTTTALGKLVVFVILNLFLIFLYIGIIPAILLCFAIFMMKKTQNFSHIETAVKNVKIYCIVLIVIFVSLALYINFEDFGYSDFEDFGLPLIFAAFTLLYLVGVIKLFYEPLKRHKKWVSVNAIFSDKVTSTPSSGVDIIRAEKLKQYSVADELTKWAKLKEDGHITQEEFNQARDKLLLREGFPISP